MTIMYRTGWCGEKIQEIEIIRETKCFYVCMSGKYERKIGKDSGWGKFHLTYDDAKEYLIKQVDDRIDRAYKAIERDKKELIELMELTEVKQCAITT